MKVFTKNTKIKKILIILLAIIMINSFIMSNKVQADDSTNDKLVKGCFYLVAYIGDAFLSIMQKMMMGTADLKEWNEYAIKYSPGIIFAGEVPALDIDFINASEDSNGEVVRKVTDVNSKSEMLELVSMLDKSDFTLVKEMTSHDEYEGVEEYGLTSDDLSLLDPSTYILRIINRGNWRSHEEDRTHLE